MKVIEQKTGNILNLKIIFSFICPSTKGKYIAFDCENNVFNQNSTLKNLNLLEITQEDSDTIYVSEIKDSDWDKVKSTLQNEIFSNIKRRA